VRFGKPIQAAHSGEEVTAAAAQRLTTQIMLAMTELLPPERHGYYDGKPRDEDDAVAPPPA
jgi:hypothetical protein